MKTKIIQCPHKERMKEDVYAYELNSCEIHLCGTCHCLLAEKIFGQLAVEHFASTKFHAEQHDSVGKRLEKIGKRLEKIDKLIQNARRKTREGV